MFGYDFFISIVILVIFLFTMLPSLSFFDPMLPYLIIYFDKKEKKNNENSKEGMVISSRDVSGAKTSPQLMVSRRYSRLVAQPCRRFACSSHETPFVTTDIFCSENLFVMRGVSAPRFHCISVYLGINSEKFY